MLVPSRHGSSDSYRYGFQGQAKDDEIKGGEGNSLNYTFRMHDPRIGRFFAVDPLTATYPWNSPFSFSENVVISHVELEGLEKRPAIQGPIDGFIKGVLNFTGLDGQKLSPKEAQNGEEANEIMTKKKEALNRTQNATNVAQKAAYTTAGIAASPFVIGGLAEAGAGSFLWTQGTNIVTSEIAGYRALWYGLRTRPWLTTGIAAYGIANNSISQYTANGHIWGDVNWIEAGFSAIPGKVSTVLGEGLTYNWNERNKGIQCDFSSNGALVSIGGGLLSGYFGDKTDNFLEGEKGGWFVSEFFKFQVETTTNIDGDEIINSVNEINEE